MQDLEASKYCSDPAEPSLHKEHGMRMKISARMASALMALMAWTSHAQVMQRTLPPDAGAAHQPDRPRNFEAPMLHGQTADHERLYVAIFDCSWKNARNGPAETTTVRQIHDQLRHTELRWHGQIHADYIETDCARDNWYSQVDEGKSVFDARLEQMYVLLGERSAQWLRQDPEAQIRILDLGGSWGALQAAGFSHMVDRRGIRARAGGSGGNVAVDKLLVEAGSTAQVVALLDPVGTVTNDVRLPPSVISGIQLTAMDEHRSQFKSARVIKPGITPDGRLAGLNVPGAHSDVCGGYIRNGLSIRAGNLVIGYINGLTDHALLERQDEPADPRLNVIHHSEEEGN